MRVCAMGMFPESYPYWEGRASARWRSVGRNTRSSAGLPAECRLCSGRLRSPTDLDLARVAIPRQRRQLVPQRPAKQRLEPPRLDVRQLSDGDHADVGQSRLGNRAPRPTSAPPAGRAGRRAPLLDRRRPARPAWLPARRSLPDAWCARRQPRSAAPAPLALGVVFHWQSRPVRPKSRSHPATLANASSIDSRSTRGVKSPSTLMAASPRRWYSLK